MSLPSLPAASMTSQSAELHRDPPRRPNEEPTARVSTVANSDPTTVAAQLEDQATHPFLSWPATGHVQDMSRIPSEQPDAPPSELTQLPDPALSANAQPYTIVEPTGGRADRSSPPSPSLEPTNGTDREPQNANVVLPSERHFSTSFVKATGVRCYIETTRHGDGQRMVVSFVVLDHPRELADLPNEVLLEILGHLDVYDLLSTSRTSHRLRDLSLAPILHYYRLRRIRASLPPMLASPCRPSLADLIARSIFLTKTTVVSRKLARSLVSIRLSRRLADRPSPESLVARAVLPAECVPGKALVAPALVAKKRAVERERVKDGLRRWVGSVWRGEVQNREEGIKRWEETAGVGRVWKLKRFWERVGRGEGNHCV